MAAWKGNFLVLGQAGTGKGVLCSGVAERYRKKGIPVYLLTCKEDEYLSFPADFKTMDQDYFLKEVMAHKFPCGLMAVVDEAWRWKWNGEGGLEAIPNSGRSRGVELWVQGQRAYQTPPNCRENCANLFSFFQTSTSKKWLVENYGTEFEPVDTLQPGEFIYKAGMAAAVRGKCWELKNGIFRRV